MGDANRCYAGQTLDPAHDLPLQRYGLFILCIVGVRRCDLQCDQMVRLQPNVHTEQTVKAFAEQPCAHQQHHGRGQLHHHKFGAEPAPRISRRTATAFGQALSHRRQGKVQGGGDREQHRREQRDCASKTQHTDIQAEVMQEGHPADQV